MNRITLIAVVFAMLSAMQADCAMLPGSEPKDWPANPDKHVISITRETANETEAKMITAAEKTKPETGVWWITKDGEPVLTCRLKTPHAITKDALDYYSGKIMEYRNTAFRSYSEPSSRLNYKATVARHDKYTLNGKEYQNVYVVKMEMQFSIAFVYGTEGTDFSKTRTVVLNADGVSQAIDGDMDEVFPLWSA
jgi:hypothetical protein